ncbi:hypothetical protein SAVIM338S_06295 [Streptomyces avidinii]
MNDAYAFIEAEKTTHGVAFLCRLLKVARSSFYAWLAAAKSRAYRLAADEALVHEIAAIHVASRQTYGVPRIHAELRRLGRCVNRKRIARLMREHDIQGAHRRKRRSLTRPDRKAKPAPDLIGRDFHAEIPGTKLVGDITALPTGEGWLYLACWLDLQGELVTVRGGGLRCSRCGCGGCGRWCRRRGGGGGLAAGRSRCGCVLP